MHIIISIIPVAGMKSEITADDDFSVMFEVCFAAPGKSFVCFSCKFKENVSDNNAFCR